MEQAAGAIVNATSTEGLKQATLFINKAVKKPESVQELFQLLQHQNAGFRQFGAVILRNVAARHWSQIPPQAQQQLCGALLQVLASEPQRPVRNALCELVARVAKLVLAAGQWPEMWRFVQGAATGQDARVRQTSFRLLRALGRSMPKQLAMNYQHLAPLFDRGLADSELGVAVEAMSAFTAFGKALLANDETESLVMKLVEPLCRVIIRAIQADAAEEAAAGLLFLQQLLESDEIERFMGALFNMMLSIFANKELTFVVRKQAVEFVEGLLMMRPSLILQHNLLPPILQNLRPLLVEEDDDDDEEDNPHRVAISCIATIAMNLPEKHAAPPVMALIGTLASSNKWQERKSAVEVMALAARGFFTVFEKEKEKVCQTLVRTLQDAHEEVRASACVCLAHLSEELPSIADMHAQLMPLLFQRLSESSDEVVMRALYGVQFFVEELGEDTVMYAPQLMKIAMGLASQRSLLVKDTAFSLIASVSLALQEDFKPYLNSVIQLCGSAMSLRNSPLITLRGRGAETIGAVLHNLGREAFPAGVIEQLTGLAIETVQQEWPAEVGFEIRESTFAFFCHLGAVIGADFVPLLQGLLPILVASIVSQEGMDLTPVEEGAGFDALLDEEDPESLVNVGVNTQFIQEKVSAVGTVGALAEAVGPPFFPFLKVVLPYIVNAAEYIHADVRGAAATSLANLGKMVLATLGANNNNNNNAAELAKELAPIHAKLLSMILEDRESDAVQLACDGMVMLLDSGAPVQSFVQKLAKAVTLVLQKKAFCQALRKSFDEDESDLELMNSAVNCAVALLRAAGTSAAPGLLKEIFPAFLQLSAPASSPGYRCSAIGGIGDVAELYPAVMAGAAQAGLRSALECVQHEEETLRRNAVFALGTLVHCGDQSATHTAILQTISPMVGSEQAALVRDNLAGTLARLMMTGNPQLPYTDMLRAVFQLVPLAQDTEPYGPMFHCFITLWRKKQEVMNPFMVQALQLAVTALMRHSLDESARPKIVLFLKLYSSNEGQQFQSFVSSLSQEQRNALQKVLQ